MARVIHYYEHDRSYINEYVRLNGVMPKTLCTRTMTHNYLYTDNIDSVTCSRCRVKMEKLQMLDGQANGRRVVITQAGDIGDCGDEGVDLYLQRLGIC